jgi:hypothetical protein
MPGAPGYQGHSPLGSADPCVAQVRGLRQRVSPVFLRGRLISTRVILPSGFRPIVLLTLRAPDPGDRGIGHGHPRRHATPATHSLRLWPGLVERALLFSNSLVRHLGFGWRNGELPNARDLMDTSAIRFAGFVQTPRSPSSRFAHASHRETGQPCVVAVDRLAPHPKRCVNKSLYDPCAAIAIAAKQRKTLLRQAIFKFRFDADNDRPRSSFTVCTLKYSEYIHKYSITFWFI